MTTTSKLFANADVRSRYAGLRAAFLAALVVALGAGFVAHAQSVPAPAADAPALLATR